MAAVIDLTDLSSDEEDNSGKSSVSASTAQASGVAKKRAKGTSSGKVEGSVSGGNVQDRENTNVVSENAAGARKESPHPPTLLNGGTKGRSQGVRKGRTGKNGDMSWDEVSSSPRLSNWGEPLPPEPESLPSLSPRDKTGCSTSNSTHPPSSSGAMFSPSKVKAPSSPPPSMPSPDGSGVCRHFWRAGDYEAQPSAVRTVRGAMDHVRVHPKFLHSNATSHKWALGAVAELLDNAVDEVMNGATFVNVDKIANPRDNSPALLVQDDGGGMTPDCMRQCMSLGYSRKNTNATIGQYGNGFKTSTMRLGADVVVFSRCGQGSSVTQSIGLLSYTFLRKTGHEDVVVPMIDYEVSPQRERRGEVPRKLLRSTLEDWHSNLASISQWSPYSSEAEILAQFDDLGPHGTKVVVYNLWFNDDGVLELDFDTDEHDIQLRGGVKQDKGKPVQTQLSQQHIANRYHHSLRVYASILYLQMPPGFQIILRGKPVEHHSIASDLKFPEQIIYKPQIGNSKDANKETSVITVIGFTKEAPLINVHGFNVYHKNRLIMPFWKVWQDNSSRGRGVVGVLEANFVEPAHDKQDFERTAVLLRLETRLKQMTVEYWNLHCHLIGYQPNTKAGKARKASAVPPPPPAAAAIEYPSPIASITPSETLPKSAPLPRVPGQEPGSSDVLSSGGSRSTAPRQDGSGSSLPNSESVTLASQRAGFEGGPAKAAVPSASAPSTPPQPAADGLKSPNGDRVAGPQVKAEPVEVALDSLKRPSFDSSASEAVQRFKRQRMADAISSQTNQVSARDTVAGTDATLTVQNQENDAMMIELIEENSQLRARCVECEHHNRELISKVSKLEKELLEANTRSAILQETIEKHRKVRVQERQNEQIVSENDDGLKSVAEDKSPSVRASASKEAPPGMKEPPVISSPSIVPVPVVVKVEQ